MSDRLRTIGHSTRPIDEFVALLNAHDIHRLVDVRAVPRSRHNRKFSTESWASSVADTAVSCLHSAHLVKSAKRAQWLTVRQRVRVASSLTAALSMNGAS